MDFTWMPYMHGFWIFPLFCLLFVVVMMIGCGGMRFGLRHRHRGGGDGDTARGILDRRYAGGQIDKSQYDAMRRELDG
jgi:uncharacterized membrane protein